MLPPLFVALCSRRRQGWLVPASRWRWVRPDAWRPHTCHFAWTDLHLSFHRSSVGVAPDALQKCASLSGAGAEAKLSDVEDHLDDCMRNFLSTSWMR